MPKKLRLLLGDQLNEQHSWFASQDEDAYYLMMEMRQETDYAPHHIQKVVAFFLGMRHFATRLEELGHQVIYWPLDHSENTQSLTENIKKLVAAHGFTALEYQYPDEYRLDEQLKELCNALEIETKPYDTEHFLTSREAVAQQFEGKKTYLLETFYRQVRKDYGLLMEDDGKPVTGKWNYDASNRKKLPAKHEPPQAYTLEQDAREIVSLLQTQAVKTIGTIEPQKFIWAVTRKDSLALLEHFATQLLPHFGDFQDAMTVKDWSLYHSRLSFAMNAKLISPLEVVQRCIQEWESRQEAITFSQIEGFVRQIVGWREYMRGIYWAKMPEFANMNFLEHNTPLPAFFWTGKTKMNCVKHAVQQSMHYAYAHHIQRLMVTGNFALLAGISPDELDQWYLGIYIDAIEWVEITNTRGMSQFADGGIVGTKPYVSSANYIHKMSDYCKTCFYDRKKKVGDKACPFNSLYWHFYDRHEDKLAKNPRIGMAYRNWAKQSPEQKEAVLAQAAKYLGQLDEL